VAGVVGAVADNGVDMAGLSHDARVMAVRVVNRELRSTVSQISQGIVYAADNGAQIINMSLVSPASALLADAVQYADGLGVLLIAAAGNSADQRVFYPAGYPEVIAVSSTNVDDAWSTFSSSGEHIELSAPGEQVLSLLGLGPGASGVHGGLNGTSLAASHVAGLAALLWSWSPALGADEVRTALCAGAVDLGLPGRDPYFGCGRIDTVHTLDTQCVQDACGDGVQEPTCGEECDDGNLLDGDCCSSTCRLEGFGATCGASSRAARACQAALASRAGRVATIAHKAFARCFDRVFADVASGRGTARARLSCARLLGPDGSESTLASARAKAAAKISDRCSGLLPADLNWPCDAAAESMDEVVACVLDRHVARVEELIADTYGSACAILRSIGLDGTHPRVCLP
jgi:cysteine-rich repeat protein